MQTTLRRIDGKGYKAYKELQHTEVHFPKYKLIIDYVQGDPFASPSKIRIIVPNSKFRMKYEWLTSKSRKIYVEDCLTRQIAKAIKRTTSNIRGSGKSGLVLIDEPGQEILERTAVTITETETIICLSIGLPANGRRINGKEAEKLFCTIIPDVMEKSIFTVEEKTIQQVMHLADQHDAIRAEMLANGWVSFIADGSILPRESGVSDRPLKNAIRFKSPIENRVTFSIPHRDEPLSGMAIPKGITLIVGGGYHGKSTLLNAMERGVYPHIDGDGREYVLTDPNAVKIRAEDGRSITSVNISPFINNLPYGADTERFSTENASGSTSQAANVVEALEVGATTLLMDEDTSATNFMIRDHRMQELVVQEKEPITPFIDKIAYLRDERDVSTILVMGGSGDYFDVCDCCIMLDEYVPFNVTEKVKNIVAKYPMSRNNTAESFGKVTDRIFLPNTIDTRKGNKQKVQTKGLHSIIMGRTTIDLSQVEQLVDPSQTRMIAEILHYVDSQGWLKRNICLKELLAQIENQIEKHGLASFSKNPTEHPGELARPRKFEIAATLNRIRHAKIK